MASDSIIVLLLIAASYIFSCFRHALNLCRKARLEKSSSAVYRALLKVYENPENLLAACHLWICILRITAGIFLYAAFTRYSGAAGLSRASEAIVFAIFAGALSLVIPLLNEISKTIPLKSPEKTAACLLYLIKFSSYPVMIFILPVKKCFLLIHSALKLGINEKPITEDELQDEVRKALIEGEKSGIVETNERTMVEGVFYLGDRHVGAFMTHRSEIMCLDVNDPYDENRKKALLHRSQRCYPVVDGSPDEIIGAVYLEDIIIDTSLETPQGLRSIMKEARFVPETMSALKAFESFREGQANFLFVMDEYGGLAGVISIRALVEEIVGELSAPGKEEEPLVKQEDGSLLADGSLNIDDAEQLLPITDFPEDRDYHTLAGFILCLAGELPKAGDSFEYQGYCFKVTEMDGNRIDKIEIKKL